MSINYLINRHLINYTHMKYLLVTSVLMLFFACSNSRNDIGELQNEVMLIHDEAMPKMGEIRQLQKQLLNMADSNASDSVVAASYQELANGLALANESMMDWMRQYDPNFEGSEEAFIEYLQEQRDEIAYVRRLMDSTLVEGRKAVE